MRSKTILCQIPETEDIDISTHGFTRDGIPDVENVTRIDVVGGLALQKVSTNRSYFRAIANIDVKLDFVPPAIINFVSRQLIGSGFKLYKKVYIFVTSKQKACTHIILLEFFLVKCVVSKLCSLCGKISDIGQGPIFEIQVIAMGYR
ncbi:hypothetical protein Hdeb2414_s0376g00880641 [Helianthus debilis subsp. tardiflorus]